MTGLAQRFKSHLGEEIMLIILVVLCIGLSILEPVFLRPVNLLSVLRLVSITGIIAFGMTMAIIAGEIDLSVGAAAAFAGCLATVLISKGIAMGINVGLLMPVAIVVTLAVGFGIGSFVGFMRTRFLVPTFITTLALLTALRGGALLITGGFPVVPFPVEISDTFAAKFFTFLGSGDVLGIPAPALIFAATFLAVHVLMNNTTFGRSIYAVGGNAEAARLSGVNVSRIKIMVMAITGMLSAMAGILLAAKIGSGTPTVAEGLELDVIAAVIIGGTSLFGGSGRPWGTLIGLLFIGVIVNGMVLLDLQTDVQYLIRGGLILAAVLLNQTTMRRKAH